MPTRRHKLEPIYDERRTGVIEVHRCGDPAHCYAWVGQGGGIGQISRPRSLRKLAADLLALAEHIEALDPKQRRRGKR